MKLKFAAAVIQESSFEASSLAASAVSRHTRIRVLPKRPDESASDSNDRTWAWGDAGAGAPALSAVAQSPASSPAAKPVLVIGEVDPDEIEFNSPFAVYGGREC